MKRILCLLLCLLLPCLAQAETAPYRGDGRYMLTVTAEAPFTRQPLEGEAITMLQPGARIIATGSTGEGWYEAYLTDCGYGYVPADCVQADEPWRIAYSPGFPVNAALFTVEDANQVYVGITSLDGLEYPVITTRRLYASPREDGSTAMCAAFDSASDICKTTTETLCATLYNLEGQPLEVLTLIFDTPLWR